MFGLQKLLRICCNPITVGGPLWEQNYWNWTRIVLGVERELTGHFSIISQNIHMVIRYNTSADVCLPQTNTLSLSPRNALGTRSKQTREAVPGT